MDTHKEMWPKMNSITCKFERNDAINILFLILLCCNWFSHLNCFEFQAWTSFSALDSTMKRIMGPITWSFYVWCAIFFLLRFVSIWPSVFYETFMWCFLEKFKEGIILLMHFRSLMYTLGIHGLGCILHIDILLVWSFSSNSFHVSNLSEKSMLSLCVRN
jgi:hypothetical protein